MKISIIIAIILCGYISTISCNGEKRTDNDERDTSLAGSISFRAYHIAEANGSYDENILDDFQSVTSIFSIEKKSNTEVSMYCFSEWG